MSDDSLGLLIGVLIFFLLLSGYFSASETAMMSLDRYRLKARAAQGHRGARLALQLLGKTEELLGVVLIGNNLVNAAATALVTIIAVRLFGQSELALTLATLSVTFLIVVFSEITPKVIGATYSEPVAYASSYVLVVLRRLFYPAIWFVNLFVTLLFKLMRLKPDSQQEERHLGVEELRTLVSESGKFIPATHRLLLLNLLSLEDITVDDAMVPRQQIEFIDLGEDPERLAGQIATSHHTRILACEGSLDKVIGILHVRRALPSLATEKLDPEALRQCLQEPYYVPLGAPLFTQLRQFQKNRQRLALVVDEYGELQGLVTLEDLLEELVGEFTTQAPAQMGWIRPQEDGSWLVEGGTLLRHLNRQLGLDFPLDGPKTLSGLLLEQLEDIPEAGVSLKVAGIPVEILQTQGRAVKIAKLMPPH